MSMPLPTIYALSDSVGETAEMVARAVISQFDSGNFQIMRVPNISSVQQLDEIFKEAAFKRCIVCHTIVSLELREALAIQARNLGIPTIDIMGPMLLAVQNLSNVTPKLKPGLIHQLNQDYFKRVEAVEFAVRYDDGKKPSGILKADIVLLGVSRTSKTPLSMYLAYKSLKVANVPLIPEVPLPKELFEIPQEKIVGLIIHSGKLNEIRAERLKTLGLSTTTNYAAFTRISEELEYAIEVMRRLNCPIIDVSNRAIEETAGRILKIDQNNRRKLKFN